MKWACCARTKLLLIGFNPVHSLIPHISRNNNVTTNTTTKMSYMTRNDFDNLRGILDKFTADVRELLKENSPNQNRHARLATGPVMTLYHQTDHGCAAAICASQTFRPGSCGLAGAGMYFAVSVGDTNHKAHKHGVVLCCTVRLGSILQIDPNGDSSLCLANLLTRGYDSVEIPRNGVEYVVYSSDQISNIRPVY